MGEKFEGIPIHTDPPEDVPKHIDGSQDLPDDELGVEEDE